MQAESTVFVPDIEDINTVIAYSEDAYGQSSPLYKLATQMSICGPYEVGFRRAQSLFVGRSKMAMVVIMHRLAVGGWE